MITYLKGKFVVKDPTHLVIDIQGIGYHVNISLGTYSQVKDLSEGLIYTHFHVKEDSQTLFGFADQGERTMFLALLSISGVGPSTGLMVLSSLNVHELKEAIVNGDVKTIQSVKGIGAKTAQRIILELKDKIQKGGITDMTQVFSSHSHNTVKNEALSALMTLGISKNAAEKSVESILKNSGNTITLEELIKLALKSA